MTQVQTDSFITRNLHATADRDWAGQTKIAESRIPTVAGKVSNSDRRTLNTRHISRFQVWFLWNFCNYTIHKHIPYPANVMPTAHSSQENVILYFGFFFYIDKRLGTLFSFTFFSCNLIAIGLIKIGTF